jgi:hypothetical protein
LFTVRVPVPELAPKFPCGEYVALKAWLPAIGLAITKVVAPLINPCDVAAPPSTVNDTLPVGVPAPELTVTVTLPFSPYVTVAGGVIVVVVTAEPTLKMPEAELAPKLSCAAYDAYRVWLPKLGLRIVKIAVPVPVTDPVMGVPPSTLKDTLPVGRSIPEFTVTVTVPLAPYAIAGALIDVVVGAGFTVKLPALELAAKLPCAA